PGGAEDDDLLTGAAGDPGLDEVREGSPGAWVVDPQPAERFQSRCPPRLPLADQTHVVAADASRLELPLEEKEAEGVVRRVPAEVGVVAQFEKVDPAVVSETVLEGDQGRVQAEGRSEETRLNSSHVEISYAVFCLKKKTIKKKNKHKAGEKKDKRKDNQSKERPNMQERGEWDRKTRQREVSSKYMQRRE